MAAISSKSRIRKVHKETVNISEELPRMGQPQPLSMPHLLQHTVKAIEGLYPDTQVGIYIGNQYTKQLILRECSEQYPKVDRTKTITPGEGLLGYVLSTHEPVVVEDISKSSQYVEFDPATRSELCIPLLVGKELIGVLNVESRKIHAFTQKDIQILVPFCTVVANGVLYGRLKDTAGRFKQLVDHMNEAVWMGDANERTVYSNKKFQELVEYPLAEMIGKESYMFWDEQSAAKVQSANTDERIHGKASSYEGNLKSKSGKLIPVLLSGAPLPDGGTVGIMTDLRALRETEAKFKQLVEYMNEGVLIQNTENRITYVNPKLCKWLGYAPEDLVGKSLHELIEDTGVANIQRMFDKIERGMASQQEVSLLRRDGTHMQVLISGSFAPGKGTVILITDLTELKERDRKIMELRRQDHFLARITQTSGDGIFSLDLDWNFLTWNRGAELIYGYTEAEMVGKSVKILYPQDRLHEIDFLEEQINKKELVTFETVRLRKNGEPVHVSIASTVLKDDEGNDFGYSIIHHDITPIKKRERELRLRYEKMQDAYKELGRLRRQVDYLSDLIDVCIQVHPLNRVAEFIASAAVMLTRADACTVRIYKPQTKQLSLIASHGVGLDWLNKASMPMSGSLLETAVNQEMALKVIDIANDPRYASPGLARKHNFTAAMIIPLQVQDTVVGGMTLYLTAGRELSVLDDEFIPVFAKQAAITLAMATQKDQPPAKKPSPKFEGKIDIQI